MRLGKDYTLYIYTRHHRTRSCRACAFSSLEILIRQCKRRKENTQAARNSIVLYGQNVPKPCIQEHASVVTCLVCNQQSIERNNHRSFLSNRDAPPFILRRNSLHKIFQVTANHQGWKLYTIPADKNKSVWYGYIDISAVDRGYHILFPSRNISHFGLS